MQSIHELHHHVEAALDHSSEVVLPPLHYQWPQLGQELFVREQTLTESGASTEGGASHAATEQEKKQKHEKIRDAIIAELYHDEEGYSRDVRYLAFLFDDASLQTATLEKEELEYILSKIYNS